MKLKSFLLITVGGLLLAGCASSPRVVWRAPGKTSQEAWQAYNACKIEAAKAADPLGIGNIHIGGRWGVPPEEKRERDFIESGMRARGFIPIVVTNADDAKNYPSFDN